MKYIFPFLFFFALTVEARMTTADPDSREHFPYKIGELDSQFAFQQVPNQEQINSALNLDTGSGTGSGSGKPQLEHDVEDFNSIYFKQEVPVVPTPQAPKKVRDSSRGQAGQDFVDETSPQIAPDSGQPENGGVTR